MITKTITITITITTTIMIIIIIIITVTIIAIIMKCLRSIPLLSMLLKNYSKKLSYNIIQTINTTRIYLKTKTSIWGVQTDLSTVEKKELEKGFNDS